MGTVFGSKPARPVSPARKRERHSPAAAPPGSIVLKSERVRFSLDEEIFHEAQPADYFYEIETGCVRTHNIIDGGRRRVDAFYLPGDFFGLDGWQQHSVSAEAICPSTLRVYRKKTVMARGDIATVLKLLDLATLELQRARDRNRLLLLSAESRVVLFLRSMASRTDAQDDFDLPMRRQDIADYLGLTIETVSRMFSRLEAMAMISLPTPWRVVLHKQPSPHIGATSLPGIELARDSAQEKWTER